MSLLLVWVINAVALLGVAYLMPSIQVSSFGSALIAALVLGLVNTLIRPVLVILTLPVWFVGSILQGFQVASFGSAFFGALLYSIISCLLSWLLLKGGK